MCRLGLFHVDFTWTSTRSRILESPSHVDYVDRGRGVTSLRVVHGWDEAKVMNGHKTGGREAGDMAREKKEMRIKRDTKIATQTAKI